MNKRTKAFHLLASLLACTAFLHAEPCFEMGEPIEDGESSCCLGRTQLCAALLYLKPSLDQSSFVITSTNNRFSDEVFPNGKRHLISSPYKPGFQLEAFLELCDRSNLLDARFTYFNNSRSKSVSGDFLFDTIGYPGDGAQAPEDTTYAGTAHIHHHYQFYCGELTINHLGSDLCPDAMSFLFGLNYSYVGFNQKFTSTGGFEDEEVTHPVSNHFRQKSTYWGIGPEVGVDYSYQLPFMECAGILTCNLQARGSLLCSCTHARLHYDSQRTGSVGVNLKNNKLWRVNPAASAQLGISYFGCLYGMQASIQAGYQFYWCGRCVDKITGYDVAFAGDTLDIFDSLNLHGPFATIGLAF